MAEKLAHYNGLLEFIKIPRRGEINLVAVLISTLCCNVYSPIYECSESAEKIKG